MERIVSGKEMFRSFSGSRKLVLKLGWEEGGFCRHPVHRLQKPPSGLNKALRIVCLWQATGDGIDQTLDISY